ncbi:MAG: transporter substrate-binding domain-containing protein [Atopobiaceae bacterium]|jgi:polar amino acid transport system substrate-binding protein|nr:transporter substrate-binding domain-containing protein [Atopobiaceae bacterium]MCH4180278.1 transporter substrate-binding domain-containing protein [Atopobiaceae bacterium]MCH4214764.1 transporter substrate-binding domain-containing protein [Atopobiaceae bacterium]MCH4229990.1 transporter substrate-binding domain-containing protein [Atopobiaceae bacterium]MCH4276927.1 transporter substrate-binding domain-containing protein [Atopobiaceae bacterium]
MKRRSFVALLGACVAGALALPLAGCSSTGVLSSLGLTTTSVDDARTQAQEAVSPTVTTPTIATDGTLTVGLLTESESAPLCITDKADAVTGMDIDIASAIADELGLSVKFVSVSSSTSGLQSGCDIVMGATNGADGVKVVSTYAEKATCLFHQGVVGVATTSQLSGKTVAVQDGSVSQNTLSKTNLVTTQKTFGNLNEAFEALSAGTVDYVCCDAYSGAYLAATYKGITTAGTIDAPTSLGIGVSSSNSSLQTAVAGAYQAISQDGRLDLIRTRWVGSMAQLTSSSQIQGITSTSTSAATGSADSAATTSSSSGSDGSTAGSNAVAAVSSAS